MRSAMFAVVLAIWAAIGLMALKTPDSSEPAPIVDDGTASMPEAFV